MRVEVYRNLHKNKLSVREVGGRVLTHEDAVFVTNAKFVVGPKGRERVLREKRKNVHAYVRGELKGFGKGCLARFDNYETWPMATYNPYAGPTFTDKATGDALHYADRVVVTTRGVFYDCTSREAS